MSSRALASRDWRRPPEPISSQTASGQQQGGQEADFPPWNLRSDPSTLSDGPRRDAGHRNRWYEPNQATRQPGPTDAGHAGSAIGHPAPRHSDQYVDYIKRIYLGSSEPCV